MSSALAGEISKEWGRDLFSLITVFIWLLALKSLRPGLALRRLVYGFILILGASMLLWRLEPSRWTAALILIVLLVSFLGAFRLAMHKILFDGPIDSNKIVGSLSLYMLLGLIWTVSYLLLFLYDPQAFHGIEITEWRALFPRMAYYSFVTITTLGYGDISPANRIGEFLTYMEAITGLFYMAIFVSSLINRGLSPRSFS